MAIVTTFSDRYSAAAKPALGRPRSMNTGPSDDTVFYTIPDTVTGGDATSAAYLLPLRSGKELALLQFDCAAGATTNLDMDLILRTFSAAGVATDVIIYNAGTAFTSAHTNKVVFSGLTIPQSRDGIAHLVALVNVTGGTPVAAALKLLAKVH